MISRDSVPGRRDSRILKVNSINKWWPKHTIHLF
jgi:hypothetical protein